MKVPYFSLNSFEGLNVVSFATVKEGLFFYNSRGIC